MMPIPFQWVNRISVVFCQVRDYENDKEDVDKLPVYQLLHTSMISLTFVCYKEEIDAK